MSWGAGAKIDCEVADGIAGVAVTGAPADRNKPTQSAPAATAIATNETNRKVMVDNVWLLR